MKNRKTALLKEAGLFDSWVNKSVQKKQEASGMDFIPEGTYVPEKGTELRNKLNQVFASIGADVGDMMRGKKGVLAKKPLSFPTLWDKKYNSRLTGDARKFELTKLLRPLFKAKKNIKGDF